MPFGILPIREVAFSNFHQQRYLTCRIFSNFGPLLRYALFYIFISLINNTIGVSSSIGESSPPQTDLPAFQAGIFVLELCRPCPGKTGKIKMSLSQKSPHTACALSPSLGTIASK